MNNVPQTATKPQQDDPETTNKNFGNKRHENSSVFTPMEYSVTPQWKSMGEDTKTKALTSNLVFTVQVFLPSAEIRKRSCQKMYR